MATTRKCPSIWKLASGAGPPTANLLEAGSGKDRIVEAVVYLTDMNKKAEMDAVWCDWIPDSGWPNRACVGTALAPGDLVEIKVTALKQG